jgi:ribonucleoside-diphosphate reductase alpha chain
VKKAIEFLDLVIDIELRDNRSITETQRRSLIYLRRTGLGVMGLADMLASLGIEYGINNLSELVLDQIFQALRDSAYEASIELAKEKGAAKAWETNTDSNIVDYGFFGTLPDHIKDGIREYGTRNITLLSIAPTGTISNLFGVTSGIEPLFARSYTRRTVMRGYEEFIKYEHPGISMARSLGQHNPERLWRTAYEVEPDEHLFVHSLAQKYIDQSISKTLNFPASATVSDVANAYMRAWKSGLKGLSVYVDGSRQLQTLYVTEDANSDACPVCGGNVVGHDGCEECQSCGWSKCSL